MGTCWKHFVFSFNKLCFTFSLQKDRGGGVLSLSHNNISCKNPKQHFAMSKNLSCWTLLHESHARLHFPFVSRSNDCKINFFTCWVNCRSAATCTKGRGKKKFSNINEKAFYNLECQHRTHNDNNSDLSTVFTSLIHTRFKHQV